MVKFLKYLQFTTKIQVKTTGAQPPLSRDAINSSMGACLCPSRAQTPVKRVATTPLYGQI